MKKTIARIIGVAFLAGLIALCLNKQGESSIETPTSGYVEKQAEQYSSMQLSAEEQAAADSIDAVKVKELEPYFTKKADEFSGTTWIEPKTKPKYINQNGYCLYFEEFDGVAYNPRFLIQYEADEWLFIQKMIFNVDGQNFVFTPKEMQRDNGNARIWEWCDEPATDIEYLIKKIAYAKSVKIKMEGQQYYKVKKMTPKQIRYFKYSYEYYKALGGTFK